MVFSGLTAAWRRANVPTRRSPDFVNATTEGVVREPSELGMTTGSPPSMAAITELVVPRSIPTVLGMSSSSTAPLPSSCLHTDIQSVSHHDSNQCVKTPGAAMLLVQY